MKASPSRVALRRSARLAIAGTAILAAVHGASASDDAGVHDFFSAIFGGGSQSAAAPVPAPSAPVASVDSAPSYRHVRTFRARPLTVRLHRAKPRVVVAQAPTKPEKVSIFEDRTLRRGDAVMTADGIRIFAGSKSWPYSADDFVSLGDATHLSKDTTKVLAQLDRMPRG